MSKNNYNYLIVSKINNKNVWMLYFFDIIFASEN
jgi:hypothetical protein